MKPAALLSLIPLFLLGACVRSGPALDPSAAEAHRVQAEMRVGERNYPAAVEELALAIDRAPAQGRLYLRRGELLEALDRTEEAASVYRRGREAVPSERPEHGELTYRLALITALADEDTPLASELAAELPPDSARFHDAQGVIALSEGRPREALATLNRALRGPIPKPVAARILFHAALAYHRLGAREETFSALYKAINLTESPGLSHRIETFWRRMKDPSAWEPES